MKLFLASQSKGIHTRSEAWACLTSNLALPGIGSLIAGRSVGYWQFGLGVVGLIISSVTTPGLVGWAVKNLKSMSKPDADPFQTLQRLWQAVEWPLVGLLVFSVALTWAFVTSLQILHAVREPAAPPRIV